MSAVIQYSIGREVGNQIVLSSAKVGKKHAVITVDSINRTIMIEDLGSANGTFVGSRQVIKTAVNASEKIRFADQEFDIKTHFVVQNGLPIRVRPLNDFSHEFQLLKAVYEGYHAEKAKIEAQSTQKRQLIKAVFQAIPYLGNMVVALFFGAAKPSKETQDQLDDLAIEFKIKFVCPKCNRPLSHTNWKFLARRKSCEFDRCGAIYVVD